VTSNSLIVMVACVEYWKLSVMVAGLGNTARDLSPALSDRAGEEPVLNNEPLPLPELPLTAKNIFAALLLAGLLLAMKIKCSAS